MLSVRQVLILLVYGIVVWGSVAVLIRLSGPMLFDHGLRHAILYAALIPIGVPFVWIGQKLASLEASYLVAGTGVAVTVALFLDGAAMVWMRPLNGATMENQLSGAASLLWGVGVVMLAAFLMAHRSREEQIRDQI